MFGSTGRAVSLGLGVGDGVSSTADAGLARENTNAGISRALNSFDW
jgi:hypothetical protein